MIWVTGFIGLLVIYFSSTSHLWNPDGIGYYSYLPNLVYYRSLDFSLIFYNSGVKIPLALTKVDYIATIWQAGTAFMWLPFYGAAKLFKDVSPAFFTNGASTAMGLWSIYLAWQILGLLKLTQHRALVIGAIVLGTPHFFYMAFEPSGSHAASTFAISLLIWGTLKNREKSHWLGWLWLGLLSGITVMIRPQNALYALFPLMHLRKTNSLRFDLNNGAVFSSGLFAGFLPQLILWKTIFGDYLANPLSFNMSALEFNLFSVLFSPLHGFLYWTPLYFLCLGGFCWVLKKPKAPELKWLGLIFWLQLGSVVFNRCWWNADAFGIRVLSDSMVPAAIGLVLPLENQKRDKVTGAWMIAAALCMLWTVGLYFNVAAGILTVQQFHLAPEILAAQSGLLTSPSSALSRLSWPATPPLAVIVTLWVIFMMGFILIRKTQKVQLFKIARWLTPILGIWLIIFLGLILRARANPQRFFTYPDNQREEAFTYEHFIEYTLLTYQKVGVYYKARTGDITGALQDIESIYNRPADSRGLLKFQENNGVDKLLLIIETHRLFKEFCYLHSQEPSNTAREEVPT